MTIATLTQDEAYKYVSVPFNPPIIGEALTEEAFFNEWHKVKAGLLAVLAPFGENDAYGQADYYVCDSAALSRAISVAITSDKPLTKELVPSIMTYLKSLNERYDINLTISTSEGDFEVFVNQDEVRVWCPSLVREKLGISA